eukprot:g17711.t1
MQGVGVRLSGKDSAINKVMVFFAGILGAEVFLQPMMGPGFTCVLLATIFKLSAALLQLGLPLEVPPTDEESSEP